MAKNSELDFKETVFRRAEEETKENLQRLLSLKGSQTVDQIHKKLGKLLWEDVGMIRSEEGLLKVRKQIQSLRQGVLDRCLCCG